MRAEAAPQWGGVGFFTVMVPPCVLCHLTDKLIDSFRLYNFSPSAQALTHKHPSKTGGGGGAKTAMLIYYESA